jgi:hypothetical protein
MSEEEYEKGYEELKSIKGPMSADEMFEKLGLEKKNMTDLKGNVWGVGYEMPKTYYGIYFDFVDKEVCVSTLNDKKEAVYLSMKDLKAINKKAEELGWLEGDINE